MTAKATSCKTVKDDSLEESTMDDILEGQFRRHQG